MSTPATMTRAAFARLRGLDKSYVSRLARAGRLVLTEDGREVRVAESIALLDDTRDPSKDGVRERFADQRGEKIATELALDTRDEPVDAPPERGTGGATESMAEARRSLIIEQATSARLKREELEGRLVDAETVRRATFDKARVARNALMGLVDVISPRLAAETDPARVHDVLSTEIRRVCDELAAGEADATRQ